MRQSTKAVVGVLSLGVLASSYSLGLANANEGSSLGGGLSAAGSTSGTTSTDTGSTAPESTTTDTGVNSSAAASEPTASATASASASNSATSSSTTNKATTKSTATPTATPTKTAAPTATPTKTAAPTPTATPTATPTKTATSSAAKQTGDAIQYKYGTVQLAVTKAGGKISAIDVVIGTTRGREYAGVISVLVPAAVSANGANFGNYSGATFTTDAFKSALESALAKF
ncbi:MAG: hypothetical protein RL167_492 [Actinomycetota bacterium]